MELTGLTVGQVLATLASFGAVVVVLYLLKLRRRAIEVPFVQLWNDVLAEERTTRLFSSLKRILSLLLALAMVALLTLALGDPRASGATTEGRTLIALVDVSASMGATDLEDGRMHAARERLRRRIAAMGADDRMIVARMGATTVPLGPLEGEPRVLETSLAQLAPEHVAADLDRGLRWALDVARGAPRPEIVIVSDGRAGEPTADTAARLGDTPVHWDRVGEGGRNVAITAFAVRRYPIDKSRAQVLVELWNPGEQAEDVELTLLGDGAPLDVSSLRIGAGERMPRVFESVTGADRTLEARITLAGGARDALASDDAAYALLPERRRARVVVVAEGDIYLEAALLLDEYLDVTLVPPAAFPPPGRFDVAIFESFVPAEPYDAHTVWLNPAPPAGVEGPLAVEGTIARPFFDRLDRDHPLLRFTALRDVNIAEALRVRTQPGDRVVGADERGPLLVEGTRRGRRFVALTFDPRASDLPLRVAFPLLVLNAIDLFTEESAGYLSSYRTDESWYVAVPPGTERATLVAPDGTEREVPVAEGRAVCTGTTAGFYTLRSTAAGETTEQLLAANLGAAQPGGVDEAILAPPARLALADRDLEPSTPPAVAAVGLRSEPWAWLVLGAFALLALEWVSFHRRWTV